jgi:hypothetical protein
MYGYQLSNDAKAAIMIKLGTVEFDDRIFGALRDDKLVVFAGAGVSMGPPSTQSYERGAMLEKRRALMQDWANFVSAPVPNVANVTSIQSAVFQKAASRKLS